MMGNAVSENNRWGNVENVNHSFHLKALTARSARSQGESWESQHVILGGECPCPRLRACEKPCVFV